MRKWTVLILFILTLFILTLQVSYRVESLFPQENDNLTEIRGVIETFYRCLSAKNVDSALQCVSRNYSARKGGEIADYASVKDDLMKITSDISKKYVDFIFKVSSLEIIESDFQDDKAVVDLVLQLGGYNLDILKEEEMKQEWFVYLIKENGVWKISGFKRRPGALSRGGAN